MSDCTTPQVVLTITRGANWRYSVTWKNKSGTPYNLTGYTGRLTVYEDGFDSTPVMDYSGGYVTNASNGGGQFIWDVPATKTAASLIRGRSYAFQFTAATGTSTIRPLIREGRADVC